MNPVNLFVCGSAREVPTWKSLLGSGKRNLIESRLQGEETHYNVVEIRG